MRMFFYPRFLRTVMFSERTLHCSRLRYPCIPVACVQWLVFPHCSPFFTLRFTLFQTISGRKALSSLQCVFAIQGDSRRVRRARHFLCWMEERDPVARRRIVAPVNGARELAVAVDILYKVEDIENSCGVPVYCRRKEEKSVLG